MTDHMMEQAVEMTGPVSSLDEAPERLFIEEPAKIAAPRASALIPQDVVDHIHRLEELLRSALQDGVDYGKIPGCGDKPALFKGGAEKLALLFQLVPAFDVRRTDLGDGHREYEVKCRLVQRQSGTFAGEGVGLCSTMESRYRYRQGARACPVCGVVGSIIRGKDEYEKDPRYKGGYLCFGKKGGCGAKFQKGDQSIESQETGKVENVDLADTYNTVLKQGKKRAFVDAVLTATSGSALLTQDIEEMGEQSYTDDAPPKQEKPVEDPQRPARGAPAKRGDPPKPKQRTARLEDLLSQCALLDNLGALEKFAANLRNIKPPLSPSEKGELVDLYAKRRHELRKAEEGDIPF